MNFNNKHVVLIILIIIVIIFIYNYDVYVVLKNEDLCKPVYVIKREIGNDLSDNGELSEHEQIIYKEAIDKLENSGYFEGFDNLSTSIDEQYKHISNIASKDTIYDVPSKNLIYFNVPGITCPIKIKVIDSVIKVLSYIPTNMTDSTIKEMLEYFGIMYQTASCIDTFYKNVSSSIKIKLYPYSSKYAHLILFLIGKFDNDINNCNTSFNTTESKIESNSESNIINKYIKSSNKNNSNSKNTNKDNSESKCPSNIISNYINQYDNTSEKINKSEINYHDNKSEINYHDNKSEINYHDNKSEKNNNDNKSEINYHDYIPEINYDNYPEEDDLTLPQEVINPVSRKTEFTRHNSNNEKKSSNFVSYNEANGPSNNLTSSGYGCDYKCNTDYDDAFNYLDSEIKTYESFNNIDFDNYARI